MSSTNVVVLPARFDCLRCEKRPAMTSRVWCGECAEIVDSLDPDLEACVARHPAGKQRQVAAAEANHPARLLGVAQVAIEVALRTNDLAEIHAQLEVALSRIKPTEVPA